VPSSTDSEASSLDTTLAASTTATPAVASTTTQGETSTAEAETTTTAEAFCAQTTILANPTPIFAGSEGVIYDDDYRTVEAPFPVGVFGSSSSTVYVSTNGILSLGSGAIAFTNKELPTTAVPSISIMPYWDDLFILNDQICGAGITYDVYETSRGQTFTVEYYLSSGGGAGLSEHFTVSLYEDSPGLVRYVYYKTSQHGNSATVGLQNGQLFSQFSFNSFNSIPDQFFIEIDTSSGVAVTTSGQL
jgi:hypothetical protein